MNKLMTIALIAGGLTLMNSPEAAAHKEVRTVHQPPAYYSADARRAQQMPRSLQRDHAFRKWYKQTRLKRERRLDWNQLFDIYRWERRWGGTYHRSDDYWIDYYRYLNRDRDHDRRRGRDSRRHKH